MNVKQTALLAALIIAAAAPSASSIASAAEKSKPMENPVAYFEIPITDLDRAMKFYADIFGFDFEQDSVDGVELAWFPYNPDAPGASGALAKGEIYVPTRNGPLIYFTARDIEVTLARIAERGRPILYPKTDTGVGVIVAEFEDSEGNRIALLQRKTP